MTQWPAVRVDGAGEPDDLLSLPNKEIVRRIQEAAGLNGTSGEGQRPTVSAKELMQALRTIQPALDKQTTPPRVGTTYYAVQMPGPVEALAFAPDGRELAVVQKGEVTVVNAETQDILSSFAPHTLSSRIQSSMTAVVWSPDGSLLACARNDGHVEVTDVRGNVQFVYSGHFAPVRSLAWSDSSRLATGDENGHVHLWDYATGYRVFEYSHTSRVNALAFLRGGKWIVEGHQNGTVYLFSDSSKDYQINLSQDIYHTNQEPVNAITAALRLAAVAYGNTVRVIDTNVDTGGAWKFRYTYNGHSDTVRALAFSPDGSRIASGGEAGSVQVWNAATGSDVFTYRIHPGPVTALSWSKDGSRIASADNQGIILIWQAK